MEYYNVCKYCAYAVKRTNPNILKWCEYECTADYEGVGRHIPYKMANSTCDKFLASEKGANDESVKKDTTEDLFNKFLGN